uniref:F-ATPase protein 6 n=1 Tax=Aegilops tauschii subsp. strangulata TaxID=200361 RepID=A0A453L8Z6_AEGTS
MWATFILHLQMQSCIGCSLSFWSFFYFLLLRKKGGGKSVPNAWQSLAELIYDFVLNLVNKQIGGVFGNVKQKFFPRILVTFNF